MIDLPTLKNGSCLCVSTSYPLRTELMEGLTRKALCEKGGNQYCQCSDCFSVRENGHPHVVTVKGNTFHSYMQTLYSYPTPVVRLPEIHQMSFALQTQLLTWLEARASKSLIVMTTETLIRVLPTIQSRSMSFHEMPVELLNDTERFESMAFLRELWAGQVSVERFPEDVKLELAIKIRKFLVVEMESRLGLPPRRSTSGSDGDLATLAKILHRFIQHPKQHNLQLMLQSFSTMLLAEVK